jgi:hypothetical protein
LGDELKTGSKVDVQNRGKVESLSWLDSNDEAFLKNAMKFSAPNKANILIESGLGDKFAVRLLSRAVQVSECQTEYWKVVARLWAYTVWRRHFRDAGVKGEPPSPLRFSSLSRPPIVQALLGLYGKGALPWCLCVFLISAGKTAEKIVEIIIGGKLKQKAIIDALQPAFRKIEATEASDPRALSSKITTLLSRIGTSAARSQPPKTIAKVNASLILSRTHAASLIEILLSAKGPDSIVQGDRLTSALAETGWIDADDGLARAFQQTPALRQAIREQTQLGTELRSQLGAIIQAVRSSAAKRQLEIEGEPGSEVQFDPARHSQDDPRVKAADRVRIITPTVFQGRGASRRVVRTADVEPA